MRRFLQGTQETTSSRYSVSVCVCVCGCVCVLSSTEPREAPSEVKASSISSSEIKVTWRPPNPGPGRPRGYEVSYWKDSEQEESGKRKKTAGNETSMALTGLEGNRVYLITVRGFNSIGQGPASTASAAKTRKDPPVQPPANLVWIQEGTNVSLNWDPVKSKDNESDVIGYKVRPPYSTGQALYSTGQVSLLYWPGLFTLLARSPYCTGQVSLPYWPGLLTVLARSLYSTGQVSLLYWPGLFTLLILPGVKVRVTVVTV
eukprot:XP_014019213.1 PREDICTED: contactin-5-like [Salmo salar]